MKHYFPTNLMDGNIFPSTRIIPRSLKHTVQSFSSKSFMIFNNLE
ncbi:hypothetical protein ABIE26_000874 [Pedobacter africanus]|uniref:Uncharacterized protein n=1 Tax=Pedobacter africanus TaxID=151894 RepID=A0ACC6KTF5_9SPHI|nr:hypothetical protein [Pedobacter africanus]